MRILRNEELLHANAQIKLEIHEICYGFLDSSWNLPNLRAAFTRIYIPLTGSGELTVGGERVPLVPNRIYLVPAGLNFSSSCPDAMEKIYIHLNLTHPDGSDVFAGIDSCLVLSDCEGLTQRAQRLYEKLDVASVLGFRLLIYDILDRALAIEAPRRTELKEYSPCTKAALEYIQANLRASLTIGEIAASLFVSKLVLQKHFKADLEKPIGQYIDERLMEKAEQYLLDEGHSVKEISERLGFCDQFYFSRKFTQAHGVSPRCFRQLHRG